MSSPDVDVLPAAPTVRKVVTRRRLAFASAWLIVLLGAISVPMPFFAISPGDAIDVAELVVIEGHEPTPLDGSAALLAVTLRRPSVAELIWASLDERTDVVPLERVLPQGVEDEDYFDEQATVFDDTFAIAAANALIAAGEDVTVMVSPVIAGVLPSGPADGHLQPGDLVLDINGVTVETADDLVAQARLLDDGDAIDLVVLRNQERLEISFEAGQAARMDRPGLGVTVDTTPRDVVLPFEVRLADDVKIGGPSAGLMFALTVYDLVAEEDLLAGRRVAGTGTIGVDGTVGNIGSIRQKVAAAIDGDYEIFLAPQAQAADARDAAGDDITVIGVGSLVDAIAAVRDAPLPS